MTKRERSVPAEADKRDFEAALTRARARDALDKLDRLTTTNEARYLDGAGRRPRPSNDIALDAPATNHPNKLLDALAKNVP